MERIEDKCIVIVKNLAHRLSASRCKAVIAERRRAILIQYGYRKCRTIGRCIAVIAERRRAIVIQYGYRTCGTYARVLFQTLVQGNSNNVIKHKNREKMKEEMNE